MDYTKKYSTRAKHIRIKIENNKVVLIIPKARFFQSQKKLNKQAEEFLKSKERWIKEKLQNRQVHPIFDDYSRETFLKYKKQAEDLVNKKLKFWADKMWLTYNKFTIKNLKSKWGSCSSKRNLNFSYKIIFLNEEQQNYLIVHELSHLKYLNHSKDFWDLVCDTLWNEKFRKYKI